MVLSIDTIQLQQLSDSCWLGTVSLPPGVCIEPAELVLQLEADAIRVQMQLPTPAFGFGIPQDIESAAYPQMLRGLWGGLTGGLLGAHDVFWMHGLYVLRAGERQANQQLRTCTLQALSQLQPFVTSAAEVRRLLLAMVVVLLLLLCWL